LTYVDGQVTFALSPLIRGISLARKILLADDSVTAQNMGRKILADAGYEVIAVNNGSAALKKIAELKPDLVILDVYMPGYSGLEVCQRLKESPESARIPVLLSVGKLEPFKPEEAQRVRADGYIVKPFEASELLSALAKLEDKVVPRAEPSKPGRFARAIAAAEEVGRGNRKETAGEDTGWKSRIAFPHAKTESEKKSEEKVADDSAIYNPMNRDLRTVVETPLEKAAEKLFQTQAPAQTQNEPKSSPATEASTTNVDMAAVTTVGLPKDVTPEEVAAIAAAVAQIQMAEAALRGDGPAPESKLSETTTAEATIADTKPTDAVSQAAAEPPPQGVEDNLPSLPEVRAELASSADETQDVPVTMAAASESKWSAVPVALEGEEATVSLDQEMQKAYAAFAAAVAQSSIAIEEPVPQIATTEAVPAAALNPEPAVSTLTVEDAPAAPSELVAVAEASSSVTSDFQANQPAVSQVAVSEPAVSEPAQEASQPSEADQRNQDQNQGSIPIAQFMSPVSEAEVANLVARRAQDSPARESEVATSEPAVSEPVYQAGPETSSVESVVLSQQYPSVSRPDPEVVKNTAAAWANWREAHDTSRSNDAAQVEPRQFEAPPESLPAETAARAVAAGAEQFLQQTVAAPPSSSPSDVASIVDSVLADLRPKLMEEISRKMAEKK
jgi:CheY-like chemotaxis protein